MSDDISTPERRLLLSPPDVGTAEREALLRAFDGGWIAPLGPEVDGFEADLAAYVDAPACAALSSGSAALELALESVGVTPGDEVVVQTATFAASAFSVVHVGATPVLLDIEANTWGLDVDLLASFLADRAAADRLPAAVMAVDLYGVCARYDELAEVCGRYGVPLVEDAAESLGSRSRGRMAGTLADVGAFSFNGNKIITTSGGGALVGSTEVVDRARYLSTQARQPVPHFEHTEVGHNYRLSNILAALGRAQLAGLEPRIARRAEIVGRYRAELPMIEWAPDGVTERPNCWLAVGLLPDGVDSAELCRRASERGFEARQVFKPMHAQPVFDRTERVGGEVADRLFARGVCLPTGSDLRDDEQSYVISEMTRLVEPVSASPSGHA